MPLNEKADHETDNVVYEANPLQLDNTVEPGTGQLPFAVQLEENKAAGDSGSPAASGERRFGDGIIRSAIIISIGNILTRLFGLGRESVLAAISGTAGGTVAFALADNVLSIFFDLLVSGAISSALIPVLSRYAADTEPKKRAEFWHIVNTLLTLGLLFAVTVMILLQLITEPLASFMAQGQSAAIQRTTAGLTRIILFGIVFLGVSSIMMATLQALQRFAWSALSLAVRNASVVAVTLLFHNSGVWAMAVGVVLGTFMLIVLQAPGLRDLPLRPSFDWRHPAIREILRLYRPIFLGLLVTSTVLIIDRALASTTGDDSLGAMRFATTLQQFTLGLVGSAISIAILPTLSRQAADSDLAAYRHTLMSGLKLLMVLIIPATLGLLAIALPTISLLYERNQFGEHSRWLTFVALLGYLPGIPTAAIDQLLIFAFYARKNTLTPVLVGVVANLAYLALALPSTLILNFGMIGLVLANSFQQAIHMTIMFVLLRRLLGKLRGDGLIRTTGKVMLASLLLGVVAFLAAGLVTGWLGSVGLIPNLLSVMFGVAAGGVSYLFALRRFQVDEMNQIWGAVARKLSKNRG
jgi:putative peptidoglycan lipid II flippase